MVFYFWGIIQLIILAMNKHLLLAVLFLNAAVRVLGQSNYWETLKNPPGGGYGYLIAADDSHVYLDLYSGKEFYKSIDFGEHWEPLTMPFDVPDGYTFGPTVSKNGRLWIEEYLGNAVPTRRNVFTSVDAGESWQVLFDSSAYYNVVERADGLWYALKDSISTGAQHGKSICESIDGGANWSPILYRAEWDMYNRLALDEFDNLSVSGGLGNKWYVLYDTATNTWAAIFYPQFGISSIFTPSRKLLDISIGSNRLDIYPTDTTYFSVKFDTLVNWPTPFIEATAILRDDTGNIYIATNAGIIKSADEGATWAYFKDDRDLDFSRQKPLSNGTWLATRGGTLLRSADDFSTLQFSNHGIDRGNALQLKAVDSTHLFVKTEAALFLSTDDGQSWDLKRLAYLGENNYFDTTGNVFLATQDSLLISTDFGSTWMAKPLPDGRPNLTAASFNPATQTMFVNGKFGAARSTDFGVTWAYMTDSLYLWRIGLHPSGVLFGVFDTVYYPYEVGKLMRSTDDGLSWEVVRDSCGTFTIDADGNIFSYYGQIFKSIDLAETWAQMPGDRYSLAQKGGVLYSYYPISVSQDGGATWNEPPAHPAGTNFYVRTMDMDDGLRLYLGGSQIFRSKKSVLLGTTLTGQINKDADADCATFDPSDPLRNWLVKAENGFDTWFANTDTAGKYRMFVDTGSYEISIRPPLAHLLWEACDDTLNIALPELLDTTEADFLVKALADCPYLGVDLAISAIAPCFPSYGSAAWCNYGTETADTAYLDLTLDPLLDLTSSSLPGESLGGGVWRFQLGSIESGECGNLWFEFIADCDSTVVGQAVCLDAHIHPDSLCVDVPGWSGALLKVTATCVNDTSVNFEIKNVGSAPSQPLEYIIVEDDVVLLQGQPEIYDILETKNELVSMPEGHFLRLESEQEPGYPLGSVASAFSINCGAPTLSPTVLWYNLDDGPLSVDHECAIAVASFDPNDKTGLPLGYGNAHFIEANTDLEYTIRFQNTGTAAAHFVVVRDTLSEKLDPMSIRPGAASHPFSWKMEGNGFVSFRFDDINLPDSNANEAASHGFVSFKISQKPNLPDGTLIENRASIYFDYNGAVQTNTTQHCIGHDFISFVENPGGETISPKVKIWPNPLAESALLTFDGLPKNDSYRFILTDISGKNLCELPFSGDKVFFRRENLPSGLYFFEIKNGAGAGVFAGKLVLE